MILTVSGFEEAKSFPVMINQSEILMDNTKDVFYVKSVDSRGKYTLSTYSFKKIENEKPLTSENFVTREQFETLNGKIDALIRELGVKENG